MPDADAQTTTDSAASVAQGEPGTAQQATTTAPRPFVPPGTQEELDKIINRRITQERRQYADYDQLKEKAGRLDQLEESQKTETEKLRGAAQKAQQERDQALARAEDTLIRAAIVSEASKLGAIDPQAVAALLPRSGITVDGTDVDGVEEAVKQLLIEKPWLKSHGATRAGVEIAGGTTPRTFKRSQLRDASFYQEHREEIEKAAREGRITE